MKLRWKSERMLSLMNRLGAFCVTSSPRLCPLNTTSSSQRRFTPNAAVAEAEPADAAAAADAAYDSAGHGRERGAAERTVSSGRDESVAHGVRGHGVVGWE